MRISSRLMKWWCLTRASRLVLCGSICLANLIIGDSRYLYVQVFLAWSAISWYTLVRAHSALNKDLPKSSDLEPVLLNSARPSITQWSVLSTLTIFFYVTTFYCAPEWVTWPAQFAHHSQEQAEGMLPGRWPQTHGQGWGSFDYRVDNEAKVATVKWSDNKAITQASSCAAVSPVKEVRQFSKEQKKRVT